ncbi:MAG: hypothetical protein HOW73_11505 [Polyangiaceae bacterium]|nr:hypothetical protein [Polyangiaceae bacterium]
MAFTLLLLAFPREARAEGKDKAGRWMANIRLGVAANLGDSFDGAGRRFYRRAQAVISPEIAVALDRGYHAYLGIIPQFQVGDSFTVINIPLTFQYDIELPVKGLFIYPKVNAGYSHWLEANGNYFVIEPQVGIKYQFHKNVHVGGEPLGFPIYIGERNGRSDVGGQYHFLGGIGFDW